MAFIRQRGKQGLWTLVDEARNYYEPLKTDNEKEAQIALDQYNAERFYESQGLQVPGQKKSANSKSFALFKEDYLKDCLKGGLKHLTYVKIKYVIDTFEKIVEPFNMNDVDISACEKWQNMRLNSIVLKGGKENKTRHVIMPSTVNTERNHLHAFFERAVKLKYMDQNPLDDIRGIVMPDSLPKALSDDEQLAVVGEYKKESIRLQNPLVMIAALLMLTSGRRVSETVHLWWENADKNGQWIKLCAMPCDCNDCLKNGGVYTTKNKKDLVFPILDDELTALLIEHRKPSGRIMNIGKTGLGKLSRRVFNRAGVTTPRILNHSLRHSAATNQLVKGNAHIKSIQQMLGQEDISSTMIYTKLDLEAQRRQLKFKRPSLPSSV